MNPVTQGSSVMQGLQEAWVWFQQDVMGIGFISVIMVMLMMAVVLTWVLRPSPIQPVEEEAGMSHERQHVGMQPESRQEPAVSVAISSSGREAASSFWDAPPALSERPAAFAAQPVSNLAAPVSPRAEPVMTRSAAMPAEPAPRTGLSGPLADEALELLVGLAEDVRALKQQYKDLDATINRHAMRIHAYDKQQTEIRQQLQRLEESSQQVLAEQARRLEETRLAEQRRLEEARQVEAARREREAAERMAQQAEDEARRASDEAEALRQQAAALAEAAAARAAQPRYRQEAVMPEVAEASAPDAPDLVASPVVVARPEPAAPVTPAAPVDDRQAEYQQAMALAANGVTVQDLMAQCGLSRPEAQLIVLLHGRGGQA